MADTSTTLLRNTFLKMMFRSVPKSTEISGKTFSEFSELWIRSRLKPKLIWRRTKKFPCWAEMSQIAPNKLPNEPKLSAALIRL